jgi:hypothetical protein
LVLATFGVLRPACVTVTTRPHARTTEALPPTKHGVTQLM